MTNECPKCGAEIDKDATNCTRYRCGTVMWHGGQIRTEGICCLRNQLTTTRHLLCAEKQKTRDITCYLQKLAPVISKSLSNPYTSDISAVAPNGSAYVVYRVHNMELRDGPREHIFELVSLKYWRFILGQAMKQFSKMVVPLFPVFNSGLIELAESSSIPQLPEEACTLREWEPDDPTPEGWHNK